jgi:mRNA interferase MazF
MSRGAGCDLMWVPDRRDMIWIDYGVEGGAGEMTGYHPMMVLSTRAFSETTGVVIGVPMTSKVTNAQSELSVCVTKDGIDRFIVPYLPKSFVWRRRAATAHPWGKVPEAAFNTARKKLDLVVPPVK